MQVQTIQTSKSETAVADAERYFALAYGVGAFGINRTEAIGGALKNTQVGIEFVSKSRRGAK